MKTKLVLIAMTIIGTTTLSMSQPERRDNDHNRNQNERNKQDDWKSDDEYYPEWDDQGNWNDRDQEDWRDRNRDDWRDRNRDDWRDRNRDDWRDRNRDDWRGNCRNHECNSDCRHGNCKHDCRKDNCGKNCDPYANYIHQRHIRFAEHKALRDGHMSRREYRYIQYLKNLDYCDQCIKIESHRRRFR